jgi:hypothetical protein
MGVLSDKLKPNRLSSDRRLSLVYPPVGTAGGFLQIRPPGRLFASPGARSGPFCTFRSDDGFDYSGLDPGIMAFHRAISVSGTIETADGGEVGATGPDLVQAPCFFGSGVDEEGFVGADGGEIGHHAFDEDIEFSRSPGVMVRIWPVKPGRRWSGNICFYS